MNDDKARKWLIAASLSMTGAVFLFFLIAPVTGYPLTYDQARTLMQIILPVFLGYLGSAAYFVFPRVQRDRRSRKPSSELVGLMIRGPVLMFGLVCTTALGAFGYSNRLTAPPGSGMTIDALSAAITTALGLLAVTTNVATAYLFTTEKERAESR